MNKVSFFQKYKLFREYKKTIKSNKLELQERLSTRIDGAYRMYSVINLPSESIGEPYNIRKGDIDKFAETSVKEYTASLQKFLDSKGLSELYDFYEVRKVEKYAYLVVVGFKLFKTNEFYDIIRWRVLPIALILMILSLLLIL